MNKLNNLPPYEDNEYYMESLLYRLHTSIEAVMDLVAMIVKDFGEEVKTDYENINSLVKLKVINEEFAEKLKQLNGFRNAIVHKYGEVDYKIVKESLEEALDIIFEFIEVVNNVMEEVFEGN